MLPPNRAEDQSASLAEEGNLHSHGGPQERQKFFAALEHFGGAIHLVTHQAAEILVATPFDDLRLGHAEPLHRIRRQIDAVALQDIAPDILPEIRQLQRAARLIGKQLPTFIAISAEIEHQSPDWIGAAAAIIEDFAECRIAENTLILLECVDEIEKRLGRKIAAADRAGEGDENRRAGAAVEALQRLPPKIRQKPQRDVAVARFVAQIVGDSAEGVDVAEILPQISREQEGDDREILVMPPRELTRLHFCLSHRGGRFAGHLKSCRLHQRRIVSIVRIHAKRVLLTKIAVPSGTQPI